MHHIDAVLLHELHLFAVGIAAMRHERRRLTEEAVLVIGIAVTGSLRFQLLDPINLRSVLGEVGLYGQTGLLGVLAERREHLIRAGGYETRGDDRFDATVAVLVQMGFEHPHACHQFVRRVLQRLGAISVHSHQAYVRAHARLNKEVCKDTGRFGMDGTKDRRTHRTLHP